MHKPTREELLAAANRTMPDIIAPNLDVVFCGINPSVYSVVVGHHFARPGNKFWKALNGGGFTPHLLHPSQDAELLSYGCGITNVAARSSVAAAELSTEELIEGGKILIARMETFKPKWLVVLGISAYRVAFNQPKARLGPQQETLASTRIWVLPNPSGLNAHYQPKDLARLFGELKKTIESESMKSFSGDASTHP